MRTRRPPLGEAVAIRGARPGALGLAPMTLSLRVRFRLCEEQDLAALEWQGLCREHRRAIRGAFRRQLHGKNLMLVAEANGQLVGQVWIDIERETHSDAALLWAMRVLPWLQGLGLGTRLLRAATALAASKGFEMLQLAVDQDNVPAQRLYRRCGFTRVGAFVESVLHTTATGRVVRRRRPQFIMRKRLRKRA
jgi:ribosomal protein S18 acetylase RimI-like enzyme